MTDETLSQETAEEHNTNAPSISERKREANRKNAQRSAGPRTEAGKNPLPGNAVSKPNHLATISQRKLKANHENAKKSTGPKTLRGKAFSRRNAITHGLLVSPATDFEALMENPQEYDHLLNGLKDQYQPVGRAEEVEVERIAQCWWRLKRAWRHENAVNLVARRDLANTEIAREGEYYKKDKEKEAAVILQLQSAKKEILDTGEISQELKQRIFALRPGLEQVWPTFEKITQDLIDEMGRPKGYQNLSARVRSQVNSGFLAWSTVSNTISFLEHSGERRWTNMVEMALGKHAIPNCEALDRLLRYETTIDRSRTRALDRLERLQRRRSSERIRQEINRIQ